MLDPVADKKLKNRLAQRRHRERTKAQLASAEHRIADVAQQLSAGRATIAARREQLRAVQQRLEDLKTSARSFSDRAHLRADMEEQPSSSPSQSRGSGISRPPRAEGSPLPHAAAISLSSLAGEGAMVHRVSDYQSRSAARLGCGAEEVAWLYECTFRPSITRDAPIPSNLPSPGCQAHMLVTWMAARLECAMLLAIWERIDRASAALPCEQPPARAHSAHSLGDNLWADAAWSPPPHLARQSAHALGASTLEQLRHWAPAPEPAASAFAPVAQPGGALAHAAAAPGGEQPPPADEDAVGAGADAIEELSERVFAFFLGGSGEDAAPRAEAPPRPLSPPGVAATQRYERWSRPDALALFVDLVKSVAGAIFDEHVPLMHPADVVQLAKRLASAFDAQRPQGHEPLTAKSGMATLFVEVVALARQAARDACANPQRPPPPATQEAASRRKLELEARMGCVYSDWMLLFILYAVGCPVWAQQACIGFNPATSTAIAKAEQQNLKAYEALALSVDQKRAIKAGMHWYRTHRAELFDDAAAVANDLDALLSAEHLQLRELLASAAPAAAPFHRPPGDSAPAWRWPHSGPPASGLGAHEHAPPTGRPRASAAAQSVPPSVRPTRPAARPLSRLGAAAEGGRLSQVRGRPRGTPPGAHDAFRWARRLLGACPDVTEAASDALDGLRRLHMEQHVLYIDTLCAFKEVLTPRQQAVWLTAQLPFIADSHRIGDMAAADLGRDRVYGLPRIHGPLN